MSAPNARLVQRTLTIALLAAAGTASAADPAGSVDPLSLEAEPESEPVTSAGLRWFLEAAAGWADRRSGGQRGVGRLSLDGRWSGRPTDALQATLSMRLDATDPSDARFGEPVLSVREAFLSWQDKGAGRVLELGRINLREGPSYAYNPTDFLRGGALRTVTSADPAALRENRLGTVMLRGQQLWDGASLALVLAPRLERRPDDRGLAIDLGATNAQDRAMAVLGLRASDDLSVQAQVYRRAGGSTQIGASLSALLAPSTVAHLEWAGGRETYLLPRALSMPQGRSFRQRWVAGLGYTTSDRLTVTAELHYNGSALDRDGWRDLRSTSPQAAGPYLATAGQALDNASRLAAFVHLSRRDLGWKGLDLSGLVKLNHSDGSRLAWLELKYRLDGADVALQLQHAGGPALSEFGVPPFSNTIGGVWTLYF